MSERRSDGAPRLPKWSQPTGVAVAGVAAATSALAPLRSSANPTTGALALLLAVPFVAARYGMDPAWRG
jgi:hypothetical protein